MIRIGLGYDLHRLVENRKLILGGINIPFEKNIENTIVEIIHAVLNKKHE